MEAGQCQRKGSAKHKLEDAVRQLQAELSERRHAEEELCLLNSALELRLAECRGSLAAVEEELRQERRGRTEDRKEMSLLAENIVRQKNALNAMEHELESFSYSISHDLRAPLRHLVGFSGALSEDYADTLDATAKSYLDCIVRAGYKLESLIEALLNLSQITRQELRLAIVDLSELARECAASLLGSAPERTVVFHIADHLFVQADLTLMKAAINHLLGNAWKYTCKKDTANIELGRKQEGDATVFYLRDNGAGFDMRYAERLFAPFQRMHKESEFEGTGIGLATVQRIIHRHGGRIWADAMVDGGATFFFTLSD